MRYFIRLSFKGTHYCGWQAQRNATGVQAELSRALSLYLGEPIELCGAGRTDAGVHAINYIAHFDANHLDLLGKHNQYAYKLNAILPPDICVHAISARSPTAHARFDALSRTYIYNIHLSKNPFLREFSTFCPYPLNVEEMNRAAALLLGTHDFTAFSKLHSGNKTSICTITHASFTPQSSNHTPFTPQSSNHTPFPPHPSAHTFSDIIFTISANRFLRNMVRAIVGTLLEVGRGKLNPEEVAAILQKRDRNAAGSSVSAQGLFLCQIDYPYPVL